MGPLIMVRKITAASSFTHTGTEAPNTQQTGVGEPSSGDCIVLDKRENRREGFSEVDSREGCMIVISL